MFSFIDEAKRHQDDESAGRECTHQAVGPGAFRGDDIVIGGCSSRMLLVFVVLPQHTKRRLAILGLTAYVWLTGSSSLDLRLARPIATSPDILRNCAGTTI